MGNDKDVTEIEEEMAEIQERLEDILDEETEDRGEAEAGEDDG